MTKQNVMPKIVRQDKEGHFTLINPPHQEDLTIVNIYALNIGAPNFINQVLLEAQIEATQ
jgi:hypothetical protein